MNTKSENVLVESMANAMRYFAPAVRLLVGDGHSGWGWYVFSEDYPDQGALYLGEHSECVAIAALLVDYETAAEATEF